MTTEELIILLIFLFIFWKIIEVLIAKVIIEKAFNWIPNQKWRKTKDGDYVWKGKKE